ncbi:MAG: aldehyde dehydrogenase family protein, partial [Verrucomicrobia bacterium]|nr:aldehyde dehydrogenase family protein [Verrucomicrobiota bacterium]
MSDTPMPLAALQAQRTFFASGGTRDLPTRLAALQRLERALSDRQDELLAALAADLGKPEFEAFFAEYHFLLQELRLFQRSLRRWLKPRRASSPPYFWPCRNRILREPRGVTLIIAPWNYPIQLALSPLIASVAAGNTVILKPSELTPACDRFLARLIAHCFPPEHVTTLSGGPDVAESLLQQRFDFIFFTGSTAIGRLVARHAATHLTPHILELGGKCPSIVHLDADLPITARRILIGKLFNAGQTCFAPDFVLAHEVIKDALVEELHKTLQHHPWEEELARIVNERHYQRLQGLLEGVSITKGHDDPANLHFAPRLLPHATWDSPAMREEIFGPILPILTYRDTPALLAKLQSLPAPLALYCFSRDKAFTQSLLDHVPSGGVTINDIGKHASNLH